MQSFNEIGKYFECDECHKEYRISELIKLKNGKKICGGCLFEESKNEKQK